MATLELGTMAETLSSAAQAGLGKETFDFYRESLLLTRIPYFLMQCKVLGGIKSTSRLRFIKKKNGIFSPNATGLIFLNISPSPTQDWLK